MNDLKDKILWDELEVKYTIPVKSFWGWFAEYKDKNNLEDLFKYKREFNDPSSPLHENYTVVYPKFIELPIAFQYGIFVQFMHEMCVKYDGEQTIYVNEMNAIISEGLRLVDDFKVRLN